MGLLADVSEVSREIRSSSTWQLVEKEQEKRWQREVMAKLNELGSRQADMASRQDKLASVVSMVAQKVGLVGTDLI